MAYITYLPTFEQKTMALITDILQEKCPKCSEGKVFSKKGNILLLQMPKMNANCPVCGHRFEKETGYFFGSMFVSYALTAGEMIIFYLIARFFIDSFVTMIIIIAIGAILLSTFNFRLSRILWIYMLDGKNKSL